MKIHLADTVLITRVHHCSIVKNFFIILIFFQAQNKSL